MSAALDPRLNAVRPDLADARLRGRVDAARFVAGWPARVVAAAAPLRRHPRADAALDTEALFGETVRVFEETADGWAWGQLETDGYVGWLPGDALGPADAAAPTHRIAALRTFAYPAADLHAPPVATLSMNARLAVAGEHGVFARTDAGFVFAAHLAPLDRPEPDFVAVAERFVGTPYLWGGRTSVGLDCSGLVQLSLAAAGIAVPRDSDMQCARAGAPVDHADPSALVRGDLLFWKGHVGIHAGDGRLLHATARYMETVVEPLDAAIARIAALGLRLAGARRPPAMA